MKKWFILMICLCCLAACAQQQTVVAPPAPTMAPATPTSAPTPAPTPEPVPVNGQLFPADTEAVTLTDQIADPDDVREGLMNLKSLKTAALTRTVPETNIAAWREDWTALEAELPQAVFTFQDMYQGVSVENVIEFAPQALPDGELEAILSVFPKLRTLDLTGLSSERETVCQAQTLAPELCVRWQDADFGLSVSNTQTLTFPEPASAADIQAYLACFPRLQEADLLLAGLTEAEGDALCAAFPQVAFRRTVTLNGNPYDSFSEALNLNWARVSDYDGFSDDLGYFPKLRQLEMHSCSLTNEELAAIRDRYPAIKVIWTVRFNKWRVSTDTVAFSTKQLDPNDNRLRSEDAQVLQYCTDLVALDLGHNNLTDIEWLRPLHKLQVLILADNRRLKDIEVIGTLTNLKYVELFLTAVDDLTPLENLSELLDVDLCFTKITDITPLLACTKLERIWLGKNVTEQIGEEGLATLQAAFPNAQYDLVSPSSTAMGWRDHPRYRAYIQMFRTNTAVEPFVPED